MAVLTALRFDEHSGAMCADQESWFLMRRKTYFSDLLFSLVPREQAADTGIEVLYGGVGHPSFHQAVVQAAREAVSSRLNESGKGLPGGKELGRLVRDAFVSVHRKRVDDRLRFLYGFTAEEYNRGVYQRNGIAIPIDQDRIHKRVMDIIELKEDLGYGGMVVPNESCVAVIGPDREFSAYAIKTHDGVLSFQSCGFESMGMGRYCAAAGFAKKLNRMHLDSRRKGMGAPEGLFILLNATIEAYEHFGQVGGNLRLVMLNGKAEPGDASVIEVADAPARLCMEIMRAYRAELVSKEQARGFIARLVLNGDPWTTVERALFNAAKDLGALEKLLRGYKIEEGDVHSAPGIETLFAPEQVASRESGR